MLSIGHPLWLLAPLLAVAMLAIGGRQGQLPGAWRRVIAADLQPFLANTIQHAGAPWRRFGILALFILLGAALASISLGQVDTPKLRNLDARIVVIDLGLPDLAEDRIAAARYLIESSPDVPTAVVAVTEHAFDVVPLTRDGSYLDRYLQVLTRDIMPIGGRSLLTGVERAIALLDRSGIQARQITVFTGGAPPPIGRFQKPERTVDHNIWLILPQDTGGPWRDVSDTLGATLIDDQDTARLRDDFEERRRDAAAKTVSIRERQDITPWLMLLLMPLWLLMFFRRQPE